MATVHATRLRRGEGALSRTRRGAELHKPRTLDTGRGSERGNAVVRLHPHPAERRIGSPLIEAAWFEAARTERNNGVGHGTPSGAMPGRLCSPPVPTMALSTRRWESTNRLFPSFADGPASQTVRHSRKIGWKQGPAPPLDCEHPASGPFPCRINGINNGTANSDRTPKTTRIADTSGDQDAAALSIWSSASQN